MSDRHAAPRLLIAGVASGVGKTTFTAGLGYALRRRGLRVAAYKCGPDYLDPSYHARATGRACQNLDGYMMGQGGVLRTLARAAADADVHLIEGMMGLFDGASATSLAGSSAELARWLELPIVLVCDASAMARSFGALVHGFATFEPSVRIAAVICNGVGGRGHRALLEAASPVPLLGALATEATHTFPERHLGLRLASELEDGGWLEAWAERVEAQCDVDALLSLARSAPPLAAPPELERSAPARCRIGVARDAAFCFYYDENLRLLEAAGAELVPFSPLADAALPEVDGVYLGGGYPELHAARLSDNRALGTALRAHAAAGKPIYAECGGLMYLSEAIVTVERARYPMLGLIAGVAEVQASLQAIGYVEVETTRPSALGPAGRRVRGHQFRHSRLEGGHCTKLYALRAPGSDGAVIGHEGYGTGAIVASYVHLCFASAPEVAASFVDACVAGSGHAQAR